MRSQTLTELPAFSLVAVSAALASWGRGRSEATSKPAARRPLLAEFLRLS